MKTLITNANVIDGSGNDKYIGDVAIEHDKIIGVKEVPKIEYDRVIDAGQHVLCPGFIDTHSHSDLKILMEPYVPPKIRQGITTELFGQDGIALAPLPKQYVAVWRKNISGIYGDTDKINWDHETLNGYLNLLRANGITPNVGCLVPHGNVRMEAMGLNAKRATKDELKKMKDITIRELKAGAFGLSSGLVYMPCCYSDIHELTELCKILYDYNRPFVVHQRNEGDNIVESMREIIDIARETGVHIHFSHLKVCGPRNWNKINAIEELIEDANKEGLQISFDQYPYNAGSTMLSLLLPPWVHEGGYYKLLERLKDPAKRKNIIADMKNGIPGWESIVKDSGLSRVQIASVQSEKNSNLVGKSPFEIGEIKEKDPFDAIFELLIEEKNNVGMIIFSQTEENIKRIMVKDGQNFCTDGLFGGKPHPRVTGSFPRVFRKYVREEKVMSLEKAIRKMTSKPAEVFGINKRGLIKEGYFADIVIFNSNCVKDKGTFCKPMQYPDGIEYVIINGKIVLHRTDQRKIMPGEVLRY